MGIPVRRLQDEISSEEFAWYMAYDRIDPFGNERADLGVGIICQTLAGVNGVKKTKPSDFMPDFEGKTQKHKTPDELWNKMGSYTRAKGGKVT